MGREVDRRDFSQNSVTPARKKELQARAVVTSDNLPDEHRVSIAQFDATTGNPAVLSSQDGPTEQGNYVERALEHLQQVSGVLGLEANQAPEYLADPHIQRSSGGAVAVHAQQQYKGIPIFQATQAVHFDPNGMLQETAGRSITITDNIDVAPTLSVETAVLNAAQHVARPDADEQHATDQFGEELRAGEIDLSGFVPKTIAAFPNKPDRPSVLEAGPFGDEIKASLRWFPIDGTIRLGWEVIVTMPRYEGQYRTIVDADNGEILYCHQLVSHIAARASVFRIDGGRARQTIAMPHDLDVYGLPVAALPASFPDDWVEADSTAGNCVVAHLDDNGPPTRGTMQNGLLTFHPIDPASSEQYVLNVFYLNCFIHDYFYMLGFREADGNFQQSSLGRGGLASDRVDARIYPGAVSGTASMFTPVEGTSPVMRMGLVSRTNRHTALDSTVVFHEFTHGVTNRLVGGPLNDQSLEAEQSAGMGEGWGDYIACTINKTTVIGAWVIDRPGGIRAFPYDAAFPDTFADLGTGRYREVHNVGEIWCATLMEMNRSIGDDTLAVQLVVDALKLSPANPSFLDMRDAILAALEAMLASGKLASSEHERVRNAIWKTFARFGMGPAAQSHGATLQGIVADFHDPFSATEPKPHQPEAVLDIPIPDNRPSGVNNTLHIEQQGLIRHISVSVDIEHPFIGDLQVSLISPGNVVAMLHNQAGMDADAIVQTYTDANTHSLQSLVGVQAQGDWVLHVADLQKEDAGRLQHWNLELTIQKEASVTAAMTAVSTPSTADDFKQIKGIGPGIERNLHNAGILTFAQLAALTPADVTTLIGNVAGLSADRIGRQHWIETARQLAQREAPTSQLDVSMKKTPEPTHEPTYEPDEAATRQHYATFTVELLIGEDGEVRRTRVVYVQKGAQTTWAGWEGDRLVQFFIEQSALNAHEEKPLVALQQKTPMERIAEDGGSIFDLQVDIAELFFEPPDEQPQELAGFEASKMRANLSFEVSGLSAHQVLSRQSPFRIQILAYFFETAETIVLATRKVQLPIFEPVYSTAIDFNRPDVGRYQLLATVVCPEYEAFGVAVGPVLQVVT